MKKTFIVLAAMLVISIAAKAWEVGDFYDQDPTGVPAVVVYVDESGEHGLIMSPFAFTDKLYQQWQKKKTFAKNKKFYDKWYVNQPRKKLAKESGDLAAFDAIIEENNRKYGIVMAWLENAPRLYDGKLKEKEERKALEGFASQNSEFGEENQKALIAYCQENNVDMTQYFRQNDWAMQLGEGWFIPGNHELELFNKYFAEGVGKKHKIPLHKSQEVTNFITLPTTFRTKTWAYSGGVTLYPCNLVCSSTMIKSAWSEEEENKDKAGKYVVNNGGLVGVIAQAADKDNYYTLCQFNNIEGYWWMFAYNAQQEGSWVAFKRF